MTYQGTMTSVTTSQVKKLDTASITESLSYPLPTRSNLPPTCSGNTQPHRYVCASVMQTPSLRRAPPWCPDASI